MLRIVSGENTYAKQVVSRLSRLSFVLYACRYQFKQTTTIVSRLKLVKGRMAMAERAEFLKASNESRRTRRSSPKHATWREMLNRWTLPCPSCGERWFVIGAREGESHICKSCHHAFVVNHA